MSPLAGVRETGRDAPRLWRLRVDWIPAYAGMTVVGGLLGDGWARPGRLYTLNERVLRTVGGVSSAKLAEVRWAARALFSSSP